MLHTHEMGSASRPAAGFRRHDAAFLASERVARQFEGLTRDVTPGRVLAAFKRAARPLGIPRMVALLIDQLFAHTKPQDWGPGCTPIVWPRNETLAEALDVSVRQLQNLLRRAIDLQLVSMRDSDNGHRGGRRGANGAILWAYGIDLRPLGTRYGQFLQIAEAAEIERRQRDELKRRLTVARKAIAQIAETALEAGTGGADWLAEVDLARMAAAHARTLGSAEALVGVVERLEARREALLALYRAATDVTESCSSGSKETDFSVDITSAHEARFTDSTTTTQPSSSNEHMYSAWRKEGGEPGSPGWLDDDTPVTQDLEKYGVSPEFIGDVCREVCWEFSFRDPHWDDVVRLAEREAAQLNVPRSAWREAVRVMGRRGAAAAMVAILHKTDAGLIERPGAYLRGMSAKAAAGELQLGRTFHGIREARAAPSSAAADGVAERPRAPRAFRDARDVIRRTAAAWRVGRDS